MSLVPSLRTRATDPERLDGTISKSDTLVSLQDLRFVNRWLGNTEGVWAAVRPHLPPRGRLLDVGSASGDLPASLLSRLPGPMLAVGLDIKPLHFSFAPRALHRVVGDVRALPFERRAFDVVTASLFLHHFETGELPALLTGLFALARHALVVNDLRRARVPYVFGRAVFPLIFRSRVSVEDGLVSIRRGFREEELRSAFAAAGLPQVRVRRSFPYRLLAIAVRDGGAHGAPS